MADIIIVRERDIDEGMENGLTDEQLAELQDDETWDWENSQIVYPEPGQPHGVRLGVLLDQAALKLLEPAARCAGQSLADYVRTAALEKASQSAHAR